MIVVRCSLPCVTSNKFSCGYLSASAIMTSLYLRLAFSIGSSHFGSCSHHKCIAVHKLTFSLYILSLQTFYVIHLSLDALWITIHNCVQICQSWSVFVFAMHLRCLSIWLKKKAIKYYCCKSCLTCPASLVIQIVSTAWLSILFHSGEHTRPGHSPWKFSTRNSACSVLFHSVSPRHQFFANFFIFNFHTLTTLLRLK